MVGRITSAKLRKALEHRWTVEQGQRRAWWPPVSYSELFKGMALSSIFGVVVVGTFLRPVFMTASALADNAKTYTVLISQSDSGTP